MAKIGNRARNRAAHEGDESECSRIDLREMGIRNRDRAGLDAPSDVIGRSPGSGATTFVSLGGNMFGADMPTVSKTRANAYSRGRQAPEQKNYAAPEMRMG